MKGKMILLLGLGMAVLLGGCGIIHLRGTVPYYEEETYTSTSVIKEVVLQDDDVPVQICNSDNGELYLSYYCAEDGSEQYKITEEGGILTAIKKTKTNQGIFIFGDQYSSDSYKQVKLTLFIPYDYEGDLSIQTIDGNIGIEDITIENLTINANDGDVSFNNTIVTQSLFCRTKDGNVKGILSGTDSEYTIETKTKDGNNSKNLKTGSDKTIDVITKDGVIDISFNDENK